MSERLSMLRALLDNPASNPTAIIMGIVIVVLALLLIVVILLLWALPRAGAPVDATATPPRTSKQRRVASARQRIIGAVLTWTMLLGSLIAAYAVTSDVAYCGTVCHAMGPHSDSWRASSHSAVPCVRCHEGQPVLSIPSAVLSRARSLVSQATRSASGGRSSIPSARCLECHADIARQVKVSKRGVAMAHEQVIAAGAACDDCHGVQGHDKAGTRPAMSSCLRCHDDKTAPATCKTCHRTSTAALLEPSGTTFGKVELPGKPTCGGCHPQTSCDECHGLRMPHPAGYANPKLHARPAAFEGKYKLCYRCHVFADCSECHMAFEAHGNDWRNRHKTYPRTTTWCLPCHNNTQMCVLCHS
jgi:hypothetical protein